VAFRAPAGGAGGAGGAGCAHLQSGVVAPSCDPPEGAALGVEPDVDPSVGADTDAVGCGVDGPSA